MFQKYNTKFNLPMVIIYPGEFYASDKEEVIHTVLGSCVSACIFDEINHVGGMNHFMLPGSVDKMNVFIKKSGRYGMFAMELLINELLKLGGNKKYLKAKIFGGGHIIEHFRKADGNVPQSNIRFIREYLLAEGIPIVSEDLGGEKGRKIFFFTKDNEVLMSKIEKTTFIASSAEQEEKNYKVKLFDSIREKK